MRIVGIDPSYTGFALHCFVSGAPAEAVSACKVLRTKPADFSSRQARQHALRSGALEFVEWAAPELVVVEGYSFGSKNGRELAGELGGAVRLAVWEAGYDHAEVPPSVLKAYVTGSGAAQKSVVLREVYKRWGYEAEDDNAADAYALARLGADLRGPEGGLSKAVLKLLRRLEVVPGRVGSPRGVAAAFAAAGRKGAAAATFQANYGKDAAGRG